jgi:hypothetical protein
MIPFRRALLGSLVVGGLAVTGCATITKTAGVEPRWRAPQIVLQAGVTTQQDVLTQLGPPSQLIALSAHTVFYYLFEEAKGRLFFLILYNQATTEITYDRAIFFFNPAGVLDTYAFSKHAPD